MERKNMRKSSVLVKLIAALVSGTVAFTAVPVTAYAKEEIRAEVEDISVTEDLDADQSGEVSEPDPQQGSVSDNTNPAEESSTVSEDSPYSHVGMDNYGLIPSEESDDAANIVASMIITKNSGLSIASLDLEANEPYYITTADSYEGDGSTPEIAESLKADRQLYNNCWVYSVTKSIEANMALKGVYTNLSETNITYYYHHPVGNLDKSQGQALKNAYVYPDNEQTTWGEEGTAKITIETMLGKKASFDINVSKKDISEAAISGVKDGYCVYAVEQLPVKPSVSKVTWNNQELSSTSDYSVSYGANNSVTQGIGYGTVTITGKENFKGALTKKFKIIIPQKSVIKLKGVTEYENNEFGGMNGIINVKWSKKSLNIMDYIDFTSGVDSYGNPTSLKIEQSFETPAVELDGTIVKWDVNDWCDGQIYHIDIDSYGDHAELELHFEDDRDFTDPDPTAPTEASDPSDDPSVPSDPVNQTPSSSDPEPASPTDPSEDPTTPSDPAAPTDPSDDPTAPSDPVDPSDSSDKPSLPSTPSAPSDSGTDTSTSAARKMITVEVGPYTVTYPAEITFIGRKADFASGEVLVSENGVNVGYGKIKVSRATKTGSTTFKILKPGAPGSLSGKEAKSALKALKKYKFSVEIMPYEVTEKDTVEVTGKSGILKKVAVNGIKLKKNEFSGTEESVTFSGRFTGTWKKN